MAYRIPDISSLIAKIPILKKQGLVRDIAIYYSRSSGNHRDSCGNLIIGLDSELKYVLGPDGSPHVYDGDLEVYGDPFIDLRSIAFKASGFNRYTPALGYVSYESLVYSEPSLKNKIPSTSEPLAIYLIPKIAIEYNTCTGGVRIVYRHGCSDHLNRIMLALASQEAGYDPIEVKLVRQSHSRYEFMDMVERAKERIVDGEIFQIVLSRFKLYSFKGDLGVLLLRLSYLMDHLMYLYYIDVDSYTIIGASPETLVRGYGKVVETYPIAGTRRRIRNLESRIYRQLVSDPKERAEHMMLVDLARNDLGRIAVAGSVRVEKLMYPQILPNVIHIVSKVVGRLPKSDLLFEAFRHLFPAGTVTGAPKPRAMYLIGEFERHPRGVYAGAVGYARRDYIDFAIAIRTAVAKDGILRLQAGAGIVYDSKPELEYLETENKMRIIEKLLGGGSIYEDSVN